MTDLIDPKFYTWATQERGAIGVTTKGDVEGHEFHGNQYTGGSGSAISSPKEIAGKMADSFGDKYGWDSTHTREGFIKNKLKQLKGNTASNEYAQRVNEAIGSAPNDSLGNDVNYIVLKSGESGYEGGEYDPATKTIAMYENQDTGGEPEKLGDAANISSTYSDKTQGTLIHEYGHHYTMTLHPDAHQRAISKLENASREEKQFIKKSISFYASTNPIELAAESYAMYNHPDFDKQPAEVQAYVRGILGK